MKHGASGYSNGCRCDECRTGHRARAREAARQKSGYYERLSMTSSCERCGTDFPQVGASTRRYCSRGCQLASRSLSPRERRRRSAERKIERALRGTTGKRAWACGSCDECGEDFVRLGLASPYCSKVCSQKDARRRRRARMAGAKVTPARRFRIHERDGWTCHICSDPVNRKAKFPALDSPVLDHVIALANGGAHHEDNLKTAHFYCNSVKRDLPLADVA